MNATATLSGGVFGVRDIAEPIQNASGHGIDLIMRDRDGGILVVEVKSHRLEGKPRGSADMETFAKSRLQAAKSAEGHWKNVDSKTQANAVRFFDDIDQRKVRVRGIVVNVDYALAQFPKERYYEWAKGLGAEIFDNDF